jgi:hypothetical protein
LYVDIQPDEYHDCTHNRLRDSHHVIKIKRVASNNVDVQALTLTLFIFMDINCIHTMIQVGKLETIAHFDFVIILKILILDEIGTSGRLTNDVYFIHVF